MDSSSRAAPEGLLRRILRRLGLLAALILFLFTVLYVIVSPGLAEHFVFFPSREDPGPAPLLAGTAGEDVTFTASDGTRLHGWWHEVEPGAPAVLFLHGNAGTIAGRAPLAEAYLLRGVSVFMPDYRGYGRSEGSPSEVGVYRDAEAALEWLLERVDPPGRVVLHGRSLGGAVVAQVARGRDDLGGVILEATFTSLDEMAAAAYPFLPSILFRRLKGHFDTRRAVRDFRVPLLAVHGSDDRLMPPSMGRELYEEAPEPKEWYEVPGAGHNDVFLVGGGPYFDRLVRFVRGVTDEAGRR